VKFDTAFDALQSHFANHLFQVSSQLTHLGQASQAMPPVKTQATFWLAQFWHEQGQRASQPGTKNSPLEKIVVFDSHHDLCHDVTQK